MNAYSRNANMAAYQSNAVHGGVASADSHGLVLMLMNAAVERMTVARSCIERGDLVRKAKLLHSCVKIIGELRGILNMAEGGSLAQNLSDLYEYMIRRLLRAVSYTHLDVYKRQVASSAAIWCARQNSCTAASKSLASCAES